MYKNANLKNSKFFFLSILIIGLIYGCASMRAPEGGPKDTTPPKVLKMEPKNLTTNFKAEKIEIEFDEYFNLQNEFKEFSISPELDKAPTLKKKKRTLEITFTDSLEKNTTYTLNFGNMIVDVNESNALKNFTYAFSTGPKLDSLSISGKVTNTLTGKPELDAVVFILPLNRDTLFGKKKPSIFTSTDSSGNYRLNNLKKDTYKIYAIKENAGGDKIYQQATDQVGFNRDSIVLDSNITDLNIGIFKEVATNFRILDRKFNADGSISMIFNQKLIKPELTILDAKAIDDTKITRFTKTNDSVKLWLKDLSFDSVRVAIKSNGEALDTLTFNRDKRDKYTRVLTFTDNTEQGTPINPYQPYQLLFNFPVDKADLTKIKFLEDSIPRTTFTIEKDSTDRLTYLLKYPWKKNKPYQITFGEGAFTEIFGSTNKEIKKILKTASGDDYGIFKLRVQVPEPNKSYVVEILNDKKVVIVSDVVTADRLLSYPNFKTGTFSVRVVYDTNKNGKWDTGSLKDKSQPEKIWYELKEFPIKPNWEVENNLSIPKEL